MGRGRTKKDKLKDVQLHISVNSHDKEEASRILGECGTTINSVVEMLLKYIINFKGVPFPIELPKDEVKKENHLSVEYVTNETKDFDYSTENVASIEEKIENILEEEIDDVLDFDNLFQDSSESTDMEESEEKNDLGKTSFSNNVQEENELVENKDLEGLRAYLSSI